MFKEPTKWEEAVDQARLAAANHKETGGRLEFLRWCRAADHVVNFIPAGAPIERLDRVYALADRLPYYTPSDVAWASICARDPDHLAELKRREESESPGVVGADYPRVTGIEARVEELERLSETAVDRAVDQIVERMKAALRG
jgi:hypothetical protein